MSVSTSVSTIASPQLRARIAAAREEAELATLAVGSPEHRAKLRRVLELYQIASTVPGGWATARARGHEPVISDPRWMLVERSAQQAMRSALLGEGDGEAEWLRAIEKLRERP